VQRRIVVDVEIVRRRKAAHAAHVFDDLPARLDEAVEHLDRIAAELRQKIVEAVHEPRRVARDQDVRGRRVGRTPALRILLDDAQHVGFGPSHAAGLISGEGVISRASASARRNTAAFRAARAGRQQIVEGGPRASSPRTSCTIAIRSVSRAPGATATRYSSAPKMRPATYSASAGVTSPRWPSSRSEPRNIAPSNTCSRSATTTAWGSREAPHQRTAPVSRFQTRTPRSLAAACTSFSGSPYQRWPTISAQGKTVTSTGSGDALCSVTSTTKATARDRAWDRAGRRSIR
jgi:hypothetical protein